MNITSPNQSLNIILASSTNVLFNKHTSRIHSSKFNAIFEQLIPLTLEYKDNEGLKIQLWKIKTTFLGTIIDSQKAEAVKNQVDQKFKAHQSNWEKYLALDGLGLFVYLKDVIGINLISIVSK